MGFAIGTSIAILPFFGLGIFVALLVILLYQDVNKLALFVAFALFNPITLIPIYTLCYSIGDLIFGTAPIVEYKLSLFDQAFNFSRRFLVGNVIVVTSLSICSYFFMLVAVNMIRKGKIILKP